MKITTYITKLEDFPAVAQARGEVSRASFRPAP